jgi:hypothetical protein
MMSWKFENGGMVHAPDLTEANADTIAYWMERAKTARHPVMAARYADLVWDTTRFVTKGKPGIDAARIAIDGYIAASQMDDGSAWGDTHFNLARALELALSVNDEARIDAAVKANLEYVNRTADDDKLGTYIGLFDNLLPADKGPKLSDALEADIIKIFEDKFALMTTSGGQWDADPHSPRDIGLRLAKYYERKGRADDRVRILRGIAQAFERRAKIGDSLMGMIFLDDARLYYVDAGLADEADRVQFDAQKIAPEAVKRLVPMTVKHEIKKADVDAYLESLISGGLENALLQLAREYVPDQVQLAKEVEDRARKFSMQAFFRATVIDDSHIKADIGDEAGDPDGRMVRETSQHIQLQTPYLSWAIEHLFKNGLTVDTLIEFLQESPLFTEDRIPLIRQGLKAHVDGDFVQSIHLLIPQIERALVNLPFHVGKPTTKPFRSGRGVMQYKNLQDILEHDEAMRKTIPEGLRMYLLSALAHPKGLNIRNEVCHGTWPTKNFTRVASERLLHVLLCVSMFRAAEPEADAIP